MKKMMSFLLAFILLNCQEIDIEPTDNNPVDNTPIVTSSDTLTYLALGDSYTIGESVPVDKRYPIQLADSLVADSDTYKDVRIIAQTGWTTDELQSGIASATNLKDTYDLVSLLIGVNNQFRGWSLEEYKVEFRALLEKAIEFAGNDKNKVFVVSIPDYAYTPYGNGDPNISQGIDDFNAANKAITDELEVKYFNITSISREGLSKPFLVANDGLHPSGEQYNRWINLMLDDVRKMLE